ncbi:ATP-dependent DNA helicase [Caerostris darwini]|uniref:ATP-dependent DNA helicase n=1 Tax=Caerostris darwini TaxID=1538125 RepID=A0AAV4QBS2_9ARAC|nr:ATP-dependent DNA helicase [Caerostris darwini]
MATSRVAEDCVWINNFNSAREDHQVEASSIGYLPLPLRRCLAVVVKSMAGRTKNCFSVDEDEAIIHIARTRTNIDAVFSTHDVRTCGLYDSVFSPHLPLYIQVPWEKTKFHTADPPEDDDPRLESGQDPWNYAAQIDWEGDDGYPM